MTNKEPYRKLRDNTWVVTVQENNETKELFLQFPPDALDQVGWDTGDTIIWEELTSGAWQITKKETESKDK